MIFERIYLNDNDKRAFVDAYVGDEKHLHPAMLVIPGGGYSGVCTDREGEPIAFAFMAKGYNCFVLGYRVGKVGDVYPAQLIDAGSAILHIRNNAEKYNVDPDRVFAVGFSAGGHLTGSLCTMFDYPEMKEYFGEDYIKIRPTAGILSYPVVTARMGTDKTHLGSFLNLLGKKSYEDITPEERDRFSLECAARENSSPVFIWHTAEDKLVPIFGSLALAERYISLGIPCKLSIYPYGPHGVALSNEITKCGNPGYVQPLAAGWVDEAAEFLKTL